MRADGPDHRYSRVQLLIACVGAIATVAGAVAAFVVTDRISISSNGTTSGETTSAPEPAETVTVTETVTVPPPISAGVDPGSCDQEPNEARIDARRISLGVCNAAIETQNDHDWYLFETPRGGQFQLTIQKELTAEESGTVIATIYDSGGEVESQHVAADEPFSFSYTLSPEAEFAIELIDGCSPGGCGVGEYSLELEQL
ncbi:MAG TPA: hypothetical protein VMS60_03025 [Solirubrobacterales bacterium]|nr:hypothetical protein [Solirubrobacterales bacterium]